MSIFQSECFSDIIWFDISGQFMRIFIAFQANEEVKKEIFRAQAVLKERFGTKDIKWVDEQNIHGTLLFIGEVPEEKLRLIEDAVDTAAAAADYLEFGLDNVTAFPNLRERRVLVFRLIDFFGLGEKLSARLSEKISACGISVDARPWKAHLTLGRIKSNRLKIDALPQIDEKRIRWRVNSIELVKSDLGVNEPKYTVLKRFFLSKKTARIAEKK